MQVKDFLEAGKSGDLGTVRVGNTNERSFNAKLDGRELNKCETIIGDETGTIIIEFWITKEQLLKKMQEGDTVQISKVVSKFDEYAGEFRLKPTNLTSINHVEPPKPKPGVKAVPKPPLVHKETFTPLLGKTFAEITDIITNDSEKAMVRGHAENYYLQKMTNEYLKEIIEILQGMKK